MGSVVPYTDNFYATLNSAVFTDGSFVYIPKGVRCPMELSTYFRINAKNTGQFERTLIIADEGAYVSYLEGCTAPMRDENQLHAAVVELVAMDNATIKYSTVQNWYPGDPKTGKGGIYNFVTKRGACRGVQQQDHLDAGRDRLRDHVEISVSCILQGDNSVGEFYSRRADESFPAGRHRHEDDPHRQEHQEHDRVEGHQRRPRTEHLSRAGEDPQGRDEQPQLHAVRFAAAGRQCGAHTFAVHRGAQHDQPGRARSQRPARSAKTSSSTARRAASRWKTPINMIVNGFCKEVFRRAADGVRGRSAEAAGSEPGRKRRLTGNTK